SRSSLSMDNEPCSLALHFRGSNMNYRIRYRATNPRRNAVALALAASLLSACSSVSDLSKERVAQSETSVQQAQQTLGKSEQGAIELQQATDKLNAAKSALAKGQGKEPERLAAQAHLYAELAVA